MAYDIGSTRTDIDTLKTYANDGHVNTGNVVKLSSLDGNPILLSFLRAGSAVSAEWLKSIVSLNDLSFKIYLVVCKHDGTTFSGAQATDVSNLITAASLGASDFYAIPFVYDNAGAAGPSDKAWAGFHGDVSGLFHNNGGVIPDVWTYLIDKATFSTDKWQPRSTVLGDPAWFARVLASQVDIGGAFGAGDIATLNLSPWMSGANTIQVSFDGTNYAYTVSTADPQILGVYPKTGSVFASLQPINIQFLPTVLGSGQLANYVVSPAKFTPTLSSGAFDSANDAVQHFKNTARYARARMRWLTDSPRLLYPAPSAGTLLLAYPAAPGFELQFSKLLRDSAATNAGLYQATGLTFTPTHDVVTDRVSLALNTGGLTNPVGPPSAWAITLTSASIATDLRDTSDALLAGNAPIPYLVDLQAPVILDVTSALADGSYGVGTGIDITVRFSENVVVASGTPTLQLNSGPAAVASYTGGSGGTTLTFHYTVAAGENAADLNYPATGALQLNGATIKDGVGRDAILTLPPLAGPGSLGANKAIVIDTPPIVLNVTSMKADGTYGVGIAIDVTVQFSEIVTVSTAGGTPSLALSSGAAARAVYLSGSGTATLTFHYVVAAGENSADLDYVATSSLTLSGGTIKDGYGNNAVLTLAAPGAAGSLGANKAIVIDTPPIVLNVTSPTADGTYDVNAIIDITVQFSENVIVNAAGGTPSLSLNSGSAARATYQGGSGTATLTFRHTVASLESSPDLDYSSSSALATSGTIRDSTGHDAILTLAAPGTVGSLGANKNIIVDAVPPQNIVFALDYSGTMDENATFVGTTRKKVEWVKDAVNAFANYLLTQVASSRYKVGIVLYSTDGLKALDLTDKAALVANPALITNALAMMPTRDLTAMGKGLAWALNMLCQTTPAANYVGTRAIVQLADGQQNVPPYVDTIENNASHPGMDELKIDTSLAISGCPSIGLIDVANGDIPVHTLGIQGNPPWFETLAQISEVTNATHLEDENVWPATLTAFINVLPSLFPYSSPQVLRSGLESFQTANPNLFDFSLESSARKVTICLNWPGSVPLECSLKKGNVRVYFDSIVQKDGLFIGTVTLPHYQAVNRAPLRYGAEKRYAEAEGKEVAIQEKPLFEISGKLHAGKAVPITHFQCIDAAGSWVLEVTKAAAAGTPAAGYPYLCAIIVDEKEIKQQIDLGRIVCWAGEAFPFGMKVLKNGVPIDVAPLVNVAITRPQTPLANILGNNPDLASTILHGQYPKNPTDMALKLGQIMRDKSVQPLLEKKWSKVVGLGSPLGFVRRLQARSGKGLAASFSDTKTCGAYTLDYRVRVDQGKNGMYQRSSTRTVLVIPKPQLAYSTLDLKLNGKVIAAVFTPKDWYGNYLGPGFAEDFQVEVDGYKVSKVTDQMNGTYLLEIAVGGHAPSQQEMAKLRLQLFYALLGRYLGTAKAR